MRVSWECLSGRKNGLAGRARIPVVHDLRIPATDGLPLAATLFGDAAGARSLVTVNPATAVKRRYYRDFARFLAARGHLVVTWDARGIGDSTPAPGARMLDWGEKDLTGILRWAQKEHPSLPLLGVGHSAGGQMLATAEGVERYRAFVGIAAQSGYWRHWPWPHRARRWLDWHVLVPGVAHALGHVPGWMGMGEDLPKGVALEWARWARHPEYLLREDADARRARLASFRGALLSYSFEDDTYGPAAAADWLAALFVNARVERRHLPGPMGHFGFFRETRGGPLWAPTAAWLEAQL